MTKKDCSKAAGKRADTREARLKAALKANLAKRKAQNRVRSAGPEVENKKPDPSGQDKDV